MKRYLTLYLLAVVLIIGIGLAFYLPSFAQKRPTNDWKIKAVDADGNSFETTLQAENVTQAIGTFEAMTEGQNLTVRCVARDSYFQCN